MKKWLAVVLVVLCVGWVISRYVAALSSETSVKPDWEQAREDFDGSTDAIERGRKAMLP